MQSWKLRHPMGAAANHIGSICGLRHANVQPLSGDLTGEAVDKMISLDHVTDALALYYTTGGGTYRGRRWRRSSLRFFVTDPRMHSGQMMRRSHVATTTGLAALSRESIVPGTSDLIPLQLQRCGRCGRVQAQCPRATARNRCSRSRWHSRACRAARRCRVFVQS